MKIYPKIAAGLGAAAVLLLISACSGTAAPSTTKSAEAAVPATLTLGLVQGQDFIHAMPARVAEAEGFFTKAGLDVKVVAFTSGSDLTKAMAGGSVNVGAATGLDAVSAAAHSVNLQAFYGVVSASPMALIVPATSTTQTFSDLKGKKIGISAFGSMTDYTLRAALNKAGVPLADVKEIPLGAPASTMAGMANGDIDGFILPVNFAYTVEAKGTGKLAETVSDALGNNDQFAILMAQDTYIKSNTATLKKLAGAYTEAINWMKANKDDTVKLAMDKLGMTDAIAVKTYGALIGSFTPDGKLNTSGLAAYAKALPDLGIATNVPKASSYMTSSIIGK
jgi:NitT/TauT family transport system substrate-binding protein